MKKLTLYFTTASKQGFVSKIIQWVQGTPFSHVAIGVNIGSLDENIIYEAGERGVVCEQYDNWIKKNKIAFEHVFTYTESDYKDVIKFCIKQLGKPYGFRNLLAIFLGRTNVIDDDKSYICSEFAYVALKSQFEDLFKNQDVVTPKDLYNYLIEKYVES